MSENTMDKAREFWNSLDGKTQAQYELMFNAKNEINFIVPFNYREQFNNFIEALKIIINE